MEKCFWKQFDGIILILFIIFNLLFISFNSFFFGFERSWISTNLYDFLQLCRYYTRVVCITNVKTCNVFDNDPMKMFPKQKKEWKSK